MASSSGAAPAAAAVVNGSNGSDHEYRAKHLTRYDTITAAKSKLTKTFYCQLLYAVAMGAFAFCHTLSPTAYTTHDPLLELGFAILTLVLLVFAYDAKRKTGASSRLLPFFVTFSLLMGACMTGLGVLRPLLTPAYYNASSSSSSSSSSSPSYHPYMWKVFVCLSSFGAGSCALSSLAGFRLYKAITTKETKSY
jgi:hypothetical protein